MNALPANALNSCGHGVRPFAPSSGCAKPGAGNNVPEGFQQSQQVVFSVSSASVNLSTQGLQLSAQSLAFSYQSSVNVTARTAPASNLTQSPEDTANNILGFVEERLKQLSASGASAADLEDALDQGWQGFVKGRDEAINILKSYGFYGEEIEAGVGKTTENMEAGLQSLRERYLPATSALPQEAPETKPAPAAIPGTATVSITPESVANEDDESGDSSVDQPSVGERVRAFQYQFKQKEALSFEVKTRDGDVVKISLASVVRGQTGAVDYTNDDLTASAFEQSLQGRSDFRFQVQGNLDEGELASLSDLLDKVDSLAQQFFAGDYDKVLQQAGHLGFDTDELASFSLRLSASQQIKAGAYESVKADSGMGPLRHMAGGLSPMAGLFDQIVADALAGVQPLFDLQGLLEPMVAGALVQNGGTRSTLGPVADYFGSLLDRSWVRHGQGVEV